MVIKELYDKPKNCIYRRQEYACGRVHVDFEVCDRCLQGQQIDSIELQTSAIINFSASLEEIIAERKQTQRKQAVCGDEGELI